MNKPYRLRRWRWPITPPYNGFSGAERIRGWQVQWFLMDHGHIPTLNAIKCEVCGSRQRAHYHLEDYFDPYRSGIPLCIHCHRALHRRFRNPDGWLNILHRNRCDLGAWTKRLTQTEDTDLVTPQVERHGEAVRTCTLFIPDRELFPLDQLHALDGDDTPKPRQMCLDL